MFVETEAAVFVYMLFIEVFCKNFFFSWKKEIRLLEACPKEALAMWTWLPVLALPC